MTKEEIIKKLVDCENVFIAYESQWWEIVDVEKVGKNIIIKAGSIIVDDF